MTASTLASPGFMLPNDYAASGAAPHQSAQTEGKNLTDSADSPSSAPVALDLAQAFRLQSMGLGHLQGNQAMPSCKLYYQYFRDRLNRNPNS